MRTQTYVHRDPALVNAVEKLVLEDFKGASRPHYKPREKYEWLGDLKTRIWLDTGDAVAADKVWGPEIEALTTNNTLVNQVVQTGAMDELIAYAAREIRSASPGIAVQDLVIEVAFVVNAKIALGLVEKFGAHVSVELHPDTANDVDSTLVFARRYYVINPSHFYVKVPLTPSGYVAARQLSCEDIPINFTLGFSARQNYLAARYTGPRYVNVFLGRLNSLVEENGLGRPDNIGEKAALASYEAVKGLRESRIDVFTYQIAASMRSGSQVPVLAGIDVMTIPPKVAEQYLAMELHRRDLRRHSSKELKVDLEPAAYEKLCRLWDVDNQFVDFVEDVVERRYDIINGQDLVNIANNHRVNLFNGWTAHDRQIIRAKGKIPDLKEWPDAPVDDLMSISALEAFAKDQVELDMRIEKIISGPHSEIRY